MKKRTKALSLIMALVMVLGVFAVLPITISAAGETVNDVTKMYDFMVANDTDSKVKNMLTAGGASEDAPYESYKPADLSAQGYATTVPTLDGIVNPDEYQITRNTYVTNPWHYSNHKGGMTESFSFDEENLYLGFTLPSVNTYGKIRLLLKAPVDNNSYQENKIVVDTTAKAVISSSRVLYLDFWPENGGFAVYDSSTGATTLLNWKKDVNVCVTPIGGSGKTPLQIEYKLPLSDIAAQFNLNASDISTLLYAVSYNSAWADRIGESDLMGIVNSIGNGDVKTAVNTMSGLTEWQCLPKAIILKSAPQADSNYDALAKSYNDVTRMYDLVRLNDTDGKVKDLMMSAYAPVDDVYASYKSADLYKYGYTTTAPTQDGKISIGEYQTSRAAYGLLPFPYQLDTANTEAFAYDAENIYVAFNLPNANKDKTIRLVIWGGLNHSYSQNYLTVANGALPTTVGTVINIDITPSTIGANSVVVNGMTVMATCSGNSNVQIEYKIPLKAIADTYGIEVADISTIRYALAYSLYSAKGTYSFGNAVIANSSGNNGTVTAAVKTVGGYDHWKSTAKTIRIHPHATDTRDLPYSSPAVEIEFGKTAMTTPSIDGNISDKEYVISRVNDGVTEHFAYDNDYIYLAFEGLPFDATKTIYFELYCPDSPLAGYSYYNRSQVPIKADDTLTTHASRGEAAAYPALGASGDYIGSAKWDVVGDSNVLEVSIKINMITYMDQPRTHNILDMSGFRYAIFDGNSIWHAEKNPVVLSDLKFADTLAGKNFTGDNVGYAVKFVKPDDLDVREDLNGLGFASTNLNEMLDIADEKPVADGVIGNDEKYTLIKEPEAMSANGSTIKEYFSHDDEYVYMAFEMTNVPDTFKGTYLYLWIGQSGVAGASWNYAQQLHVGTNGVVSDSGARRSDKNYAPYNFQNFSGAWASAEGKTIVTGTTAVMEIKLSKADLAELGKYDDLKDLSNIRYTAWYLYGNDQSAFGSNILKNDSIAYDMVQYYNDAYIDSCELPEGAEYVYSKWNGNYIAKNLNLNYADIVTADKGSIRISTFESSGLRFMTTVNKKLIDDAIAAEKTVTVGTLVIPIDYLEDGEALTHDVDKLKLDIQADINTPYRSGVTTYTFTGSITNIKPGNINRVFVAVGYVCIDGVYTYAEGTEQAVKDVAQRVIDSGDFANDESVTAILNYLTTGVKS